jgi:hypothetical protein
MARSRNTAETVTITISTTPAVRDHLQAIANCGLDGKNVAEVAERLISESIRKRLKKEAATDHLTELARLRQEKVRADS